MAMPEAQQATNIWVQVGGGIVGILTALGMIWNWLRGQRQADETKPASHLVMEAASLADIRPFSDRIDKLQLSFDTLNLGVTSILTIQREILAEMRSQAKEERDRWDSKERDELIELRNQQRIDAALERLRHEEHTRARAGR